MRSVLDICPSIAWGANSPCEVQKRTSRIRSFYKSDANPVGGVPPCRWSISGRVLMPCGHGSGTQRAAHLRRGRFQTVLDGRTSRPRKPERNHSDDKPSDVRTSFPSGVECLDAPW